MTKMQIAYFIIGLFGVIVAYTAFSLYRSVRRYKKEISSSKPVVKKEVNEIEETEIVPKSKRDEEIIDLSKDMYISNAYDDCILDVLDYKATGVIYASTRDTFKDYLVLEESTSKDGDTVYSIRLKENKGSLRDISNTGLVVGDLKALVTIGFSGLLEYLSKNPDSQSSLEVSKKIKELIPRFLGAGDWKENWKNLDEGVSIENIYKRLNSISYDGASARFYLTNFENEILDEENDERFIIGIQMRTLKEYSKKRRSVSVRVYTYGIQCVFLLHGDIPLKNYYSY